MIPLRQALETVLRKYYNVTPHDLLDDLVAAIPQPRREALENILRDCHPSVLVGRVMDWAAGQAWCEHCVKYLPAKAFIFDHQINVPNYWTVCPICARPRPESP